MMEALWPDHPNKLAFRIFPQCYFQDLDLSSLESGGIQLKISHQLSSSSFRRAVSVVIALEKLRKFPVVCSQDFQDDDLRSLFFLIFVEGT